MKHIKIYEGFEEERSAEMELPVDDSDSHFETESTDFSPILDGQEGDYLVNFTNADGEETTISIGHSIDPEYTGKNMISSIEMVPGSSSDGREYSIVGYYEEIEGSFGAYELKKVLIEG